jgi:hypothetical protein
MRIAFSLLTCVPVAACAGVGAPPPVDQPRAYFPVGGIVDVIDIDAVDRLPLRSAELIAPDGKSTPAGSINAYPSPSETIYRPSIAGPNAGAAFGPPDPAIAGQASAAVGAAVQTRSRLLATVSTASIALPDPAAYRRGWQKYRIRLHFGEPSAGGEIQEIAAPPPPAGG